MLVAAFNTEVTAPTMLNFVEARYVHFKPNSFSNLGKVIASYLSNLPSNNAKPSYFVENKPDSVCTSLELLPNLQNPLIAPHDPYRRQQ
jgi:hypothetical protein